MEAKMADRDVFGRSLPEDRTLPSGIPPIIGILLSVIAIVGFLLIATLFHRDNGTGYGSAEPANVQGYSGNAAPPPPFLKGDSGQ